MPRTLREYQINSARIRLALAVFDDMLASIEPELASRFSINDVRDAGYIAEIEFQMAEDTYSVSVQVEQVHFHDFALVTIFIYETNDGKNMPRLSIAFMASMGGSVPKLRLEDMEFASEPFKRFVRDFSKSHSLSSTLNRLLTWAATNS